MLSEEEFKELKEIVDSISTHIPEHQAGYIWRMYNRIEGDHGGQPCMCASAARYWKAAFDSLKSYVKSNT